MTVIDTPPNTNLHVVTADLNRRAGYGMVKVNIRRFSGIPEAGDSVILLDGEDKLYGVVDTVEVEQRVVYVRIATW